jgi:hypothetical protein
MMNKIIYTDCSNPEYCDKFFCAYVSHHHYWFESYDDLLSFMDSDLYDARMKTSVPAKSN